jgi:hypothetical protein
MKEVAVPCIWPQLRVISLLAEELAEGENHGIRYGKTRGTSTKIRRFVYSWEKNIYSDFVVDRPYKSISHKQ